MPESSNDRPRTRYVTDENNPQPDLLRNVQVSCADTMRRIGETAAANATDLTPAGFSTQPIGSELAL